MQQAYQTEQAYEAQVKALEAQLDPMSALVAAGDKLSSSLGGLSQGVGSLGDLFNIDTSGIENVISKIQQIAQLPQTIGGIIESVKGIGGAVSGVLGSLGSVSGAMIRCVTINNAATPPAMRCHNRCFRVSATPPLPLPGGENCFEPPDSSLSSSMR